VLLPVVFDDEVHKKKRDKDEERHAESNDEKKDGVHPAGSR
jgi:hypothetical protein